MNSRQPGPRRVWKVGSEADLLPPHNRDPRDQLNQLESAERLDLVRRRGSLEHATPLPKSRAIKSCAQAWHLRALDPSQERLQGGLEAERLWEVLGELWEAVKTKIYVMCPKNKIPRLG